MKNSESRALELLRTVPMTTHELAYRIGVTAAYAQRLLEQLRDAGDAHVVRKLTQTGHPWNVWSAAA